MTTYREWRYSSTILDPGKKINNKVVSALNLLNTTL
jgi:hypothetical protein